MFRALLAFIALPGVIAFAIPLLLPGRADTDFRLIALLPLVAGTGLLLWCVREFYVAGKGTLAPWDPPRHLVSSGLYRISRNPMYVAVTLILIGWAIGFGGWGQWTYVLAVLVAFHVRVRLHEEPYLARRHRDEWPRYTARVPRWIFRSRRAVLVAWAAVLVSLPMAGLIYEAIADGVAQKEFAAPGTMVDIGGRRVHLLCIGEGAPVVVFVHSGWGNSISSSRAREQVATRTKVCSYDRSGYGWSDPGPDVASMGSLVRDLAVLQDRAKLPSPIVLVASSIGGLTTELFARRFPERVAGLVFLDAANSLTLGLRDRVRTWAQPAACASGIAAHLGVLRLLDPFDIGQATDEARRGSALTYNARVWDQLCAMARGLPDTVRDFEQAPPLRSDVPMTVLSAATTESLAPPGVSWLLDVAELRAVLVDAHEKFAKLSSKGKWAVVPESGHLIASSQPDAVADVVIEMLEEIR